ncbi:proline-rich protein 5a isoform X1 [Alosa sapidissima]|uniref:proline-rich protein 5a isoform X1 n=1 Tax=Alosa sapidissima TaxID=34773 RepID=UPI001C081E08|nr:proline-rich protein 5a isoform X1 [Alosa sapidissima]XP_041966480.1 proline-rich protein 5a isoform X1 [Alosa sapidissima]
MLDGLHGGQSCVPSSRPVSISVSSLSLLPHCFYMDGSNHPIRRTLYRLKLVSSPNLTQLGKSDKASLEDRGNGPNAVWNSIHNAVIGVFQRKGLADNELYALNEGVRQLLKTELGSFFTEYLQKQLLTKGMVILRDKIRFYEGQKLLDSLAETWDFFFGDVLSMLQAIFHPVQGKEPSVRQLALLHFRNTITLNMKLEEALCRPRARIPPSIVQMLLILQGVHESRGVSEEYIRLEALIQRVVSPYLGTQGLRSHENPLSECSYTLDKHLHWAWSKPGDAHTNPVVRSKSYNIPMLTPVAEYDSEVGSLGSVGIRRHSACEVSACLEQPGYPMLGTTVDTGSTPRLCLEHDLPLRGASVQPGLLSSAIFPPHCAGTLHPPGGQPCHPELAKAHSSPASCSSSPETTIVQGLDSLDSDQEGIFIDFSHCRSESYGTTRQTS